MVCSAWMSERSADASGSSVIYDKDSGKILSPVMGEKMSHKSSGSSSSLIPL